MGFKESLMGVFALGSKRTAEPPRYRAILPGLIVTDESAWAWYVVPATNSDLYSVEERDAEEKSAQAAVRQALSGREFEVRTLWGQVSGEDYLDGLGIEDDDDESVHEWAQIRAGDIDDLDLPDRTVVLGVKIANRGGGARKAGEAMGVVSTLVSDAELATLETAAYQLGSKLTQTVWRVRLAAPDLLAWMVSREMRRDPLVPMREKIEGAALARLTSGFVEPWSDHLRIKDAEGQIASYAAVLALTDFPEEMETPGQEWIEVLNGLETTPLLGGREEAEPIKVLAEARIRGRVLPQREARDDVNDVRKAAKEQRRSAQEGLAGEAPEDVEEAEVEAGELLRDLKRGHAQLVEVSPRVIVSAPTRAGLDAKVAAVQAALDNGCGITAAVMVDEQREGWLECMPCDQVRVPDLVEPMDTAAFVQSWFWGGCRVGERQSEVPAIGYTTGSTQVLVRYLANYGVDRSDAPVTVFGGRTRRGKTTGMMLTLLDVCLAPINRGRDPWCLFIDIKGDGTGLADAAAYLGVPSTLIEVGEDDAGVLDTFQVSAPEHARDNAAAGLMLLLPWQLAQEGAPYIQQAVAYVADTEPEGEWWSWKAIEFLGDMAAQDEMRSETLRMVYETLRATSTAGFGALVAGKPHTARTSLTMSSGINVLHLPGMHAQLPKVGQRDETWTPPQRAAVAALRGVLGWCTYVAGAMAARRRVKVVAVPETHLLTATADGAMFLDQQARMGAAFGLAMLLDTQDMTGLMALPGLVESLCAVFGFAQATTDEQDALAQMVNLPVGDPDIHDLIRTLDRQASNVLVRSDDGNQDVRRGHCLHMDRAGDVATMQWVVPSPEVLALLDTSARATADRHEREAG